jgi:hypothetical protein
MFKFLLGVAFGAAGYWAWQSFGRDLLGLGSDQDTYGGYNSGTSFSSGSSSYGSGTTSSPSTVGGMGSASPTPTSSATGESTSTSS